MPGSDKIDPWPTDVGVIAMEVYFPSQYVDQAELEVFDNASTGKYTIGLGQSKMGFCSDREDINSLCLTVVQKLIEKNHISYNDIGRLEVGTETIIDKSKSTKTVLMQLFESSGNHSIEGIDTTNACFGGTSALFNAINWIESSSWDGRYAMVVAGDIAVYSTGNARCTGGAGAVALLIGKDAPLVFDRGVRSIHMQHAYDFYKPNMDSEYPVVDGKLSVKCYLHALDKCYQGYREKAKLTGIIKEDSGLIDSVDAFVFHSPFCKLVQKSFARIFLNDFLRESSPDFFGRYAGLESFRDLKLEDSYFDRDAEKALMAASNSMFTTKTKPSLLLANQVGNMYTPSVYGGLASYLLSASPSELVGHRVVLFSYGSGLASAMFSLRITKDLGPKFYKLFENLSNINQDLQNRVKVSPEEFDKTMILREETHNKAPYSPVGSTDGMCPGSWYLTEVDSMYRRKYDRVPLVQLPNGNVKGTVPTWNTLW
ncbi:hydroxymethylglutaryl-CoA synthase 1-like isoform X2 [Ostrea edulis]|uniref:hydroxymethylglutaryl-CoA synthase 1-like isoform X2 n=1 Tax=Ostrea edulis TaxID=37623 RepID=UPI0020953561|nr:hydroxymethylglutaryl-CoA synthase 1-like isoform X2 [Ostrea edulis]